MMRSADALERISGVCGRSASELPRGISAGIPWKSRRRWVCSTTSSLMSDEDCYELAARWRGLPESWSFRWKWVPR